MERLARRCPILIGLGDEGVCLRTAELPGELAPDRVDVGPVRLGVAGRGEVIAHDGDPADRLAGQRIESAGREKLLRILGELADPETGGHVPESEHRVGLAATEVGLQVDHRRGVGVPRQSAHGAADEVAQTLGEVGATEELDRVGIVGVSFGARGHLVEVGSELRGVEVARRHVVVWRQDLAPRLETRSTRS